MFKGRNEEHIIQNISINHNEDNDNEYGTVAGFIDFRNERTIQNMELIHVLIGSSA